MPKLQSVQSWDETFFQKYVTPLKGFALNPLWETQTFNELKKLFGPQGCLNEHWTWEAIILTDDDNSALASVLWTYPKNTQDDIQQHCTQFLPCGFWAFSKSSATLNSLPILMEHLKNKASSLGLNTIKAPIDGHFFIHYRWAINPNGKQYNGTFYGEPLRPDYYFHCLEIMGFSEDKQWASHHVNIQAMRELCSERIQKIYPSGIPSHLSIKNVNLRKWDQHMNDVHRLFLASYSKMSEYMPIDLHSFKKLYADYKHIIEEQHSFILYEDDVATAFLIGYHDPKKAIKNYMTSTIPEPFKKLKLYWDLKRRRANNCPLIFPYVGRDPTAKNSKGAMVLLFQKALEHSKATQFISAYVAQDAPSLASLPTQISPFARYTTFRALL